MLADVAAILTAVAALVTSIATAVRLLRGEARLRVGEQRTRRLVLELAQERDELRARCRTLETDLGLLKQAADDSGLFRILAGSDRRQ